MKNIIIQILIFIVISILFAAWAIEMTASGFNYLKFYLIYIPLLIFLITEIYLIYKIKSLTKNKIVFKLFSFLIVPIVLFTFLFFSFGESKNKICIVGNCENGYGESLYIRSGQRNRSKPEFLGRNWYNNIVWYDGNPIKEYYAGNFKNGQFHGEGRVAYNFRGDTKGDGPGYYVIGGEWENGQLLWDKSTRYNGWLKMTNKEFKRFLKKLKISNNPLNNGPHTNYENAFYYHKNNFILNPIH